MPLSEFHPATGSKLEPSESKTPNFSPDLPSAMAEGDFVELLWDNGQIVMQGQSSRPKKSPLSSTFPSHSSRIPGKDDMAQRIARYVTGMDSPREDSTQSTIPGTVTLDAQEDDMSPWFNSSLDDYYYEFLSELSGVHANSVRSHGSNLTLINKDAPTDAVGPSQVIRESNDAEPHVPRFPAVTSVGDVDRALTVQQNPHVHEWQNSTQLSKPRPLELRGLGSSLVSGHNPSWEFPNTKDQRPDASSPKPPMPPKPSTTTGVINFSHFSRATSLLKANTQNGNKERGNKASYTVVNNSLESIVNSSHNGPKSTVQEHLGPTFYKAEHKSAAQPLQPFTSSTSQSEAVNWRDEMGNAIAVASVNNGNRALPDLHIQKMGSEVMPVPPSIAKHDVEKVPEPVMALSSVCSGNGDATESSEPVYRAKRKGTEEDSGYQSEDIDDESMGTKKPSGTSATTTKRSRAAEVHNLSERRRRDRINEKMRALQELIPNCNKVDKASMLDEAIEYLKTLQLQVQIMSMSSGFCMPPMMFPPAMQHMRPPHMAHFPPMGVGVRMGMGVGYGMGMVDMNGNPLIPIQPIPNPQFPCSYMGSTSLHSIPPSTSSGLPMFGVPSPGVAQPMHCAPALVPVTAHSAWPRGSPEVTRLVGGPFHSEMLEPASSRDQHAQIIGSEIRQRPEDSQVTQSAQPTKDIDEPSSSAPTNEQVSNVEEAGNSSIGNGSSSSGASFDNGTGRA